MLVGFVEARTIKIIQLVQGGRLAEDPFEKTYQVYNRRTKETEEVCAVVKGNKENVMGMLVLGPLSKVLNLNNKQWQAANEEIEAESGEHYSGGRCLL
jgi:hypothetical protein